MPDQKSQTILKLSSIPQREVIPGYRARFVHTERTTHAYWEIDANHAIPKHSHPHEQIVNMIEGEFTLTVSGTPLTLGPGDIVVIAPNVPHSGIANTDCQILDVFCPPREDYQ